MKILFLPNWEVPTLEIDDESIQAPNKYVQGKPYWFFRYFPAGTKVDIIDIQKKNKLHLLEKNTLKIYIWQAIKAFRKRKKYDIVISHGAPSGIVYSFLRRLFPEGPPHYIFDIGGMNGGRDNRIETSILKIALKSNPYIICHSKIIIENYKKTYRNLLEHSVFIPFGVDTDYFSPLKSDATGEKYILSFGAGASARDYKTLIKAWQELDYKDFKLRIIGERPPYEEEWPSNLEFPGMVPIKTLMEQICHSLFVVIPLPVFNFSYAQMSFLQSMSLGKTVIVTKTPGSIDYLQDYQGSFFVNPYDVEDMKEKIRLLLDEPEILKESGAKARPYILEHFTEELLGKKVAQLVVSNSAGKD